jgi:cystinosin
LLNIVGFAGYTASTAAFLYSSTVREQYAARYSHAPTPTVRGNDFAFAVHASVCCCITLSQFWPRLWGFTGDAAPRRPSSAALGIVTGCAVSVIAVAILVLSTNFGTTPWAAIDIVRLCPFREVAVLTRQAYTLSYVKLVITLVKYIPQAWHHYSVQSTAGWAMPAIMLDFAGGITSLGQLVIDSLLSSTDWSGLTGNPVKLGLGVLSLSFDVLFLVQHYLLYRDTDRAEPRETSRLLR